MTKLLGILGGTGPESTIDYYRLVIARWRERTGDDSYPPIVINSIDLTHVVKILARGDSAALTDHLTAELGRLARAGATLGILAANTLHTVFDDVRARSPIPLLSIVETACDEARVRGLGAVGLLGTKYTMEGGFYRKVFDRASIRITAPGPAERETLHEIYMGELVKGVFREETRERFAELIRRMRREEGIDGVILGGTELPLLLRGAGGLDLPLLDTAQIHVDRTLDELLG